MRGRAPATRATRAPSRCATDDINTLFVGLTGPTVRVTRIRSDIAQSAMTTDFVLQASSDQSELSNVRTGHAEREPDMPHLRRLHGHRHGNARAGASERWRRGLGERRGLRGRRHGWRRGRHPERGRRIRDEGSSDGRRGVRHLRARQQGLWGRIRRLGGRAGSPRRPSHSRATPSFAAKRLIRSPNPSQRLGGPKPGDIAGPRGYLASMGCCKTARLRPVCFAS